MFKDALAQKQLKVLKAWQVDGLPKLPWRTINPTVEQMQYKEAGIVLQITVERSQDGMTCRVRADLSGLGQGNLLMVNREIEYDTYVRRHAERFVSEALPQSIANLQRAR